MWYFNTGTNFSDTRKYTTLFELFFFCVSVVAFLIFILFSKITCLKLRVHLHYFLNTCYLLNVILCLLF